MATIIENVARPCHKVSAVWQGALLCLLCGFPLKYAHPGVTRKVEDEDKVILLRQHYYLCSNEECPLHKPFHAPQNIVLPYKKYSRTVYEKIIRIYHEVGANPRQISAMLKIYSSVTPSLQTIQRYIDDFLLLQSDLVESTMLHKVQSQKGLILILDGQRPKRGSSSLWTFLDVLSGEQVHAEFLTKADSITLGTILHKIEQKYEVQIQGIISDHQKSIVKAIETYFPHIKHQFCHFHFLKNLADPLEKMDSHLHSSLSIGINSLYINIASTSKQIEIVPGIQKGVQEFFQPLMQDIQSKLFYPSRLFDSWGGVQTYDALKEYLEQITQEIIPLVSKSSRIGKIIQKTVITIQGLLESQFELYTKLQRLVPLFDELRNILGIQAFSKRGMQEECTKWQAKLLKKLQTSTEFIDLNAPICQLNHRTPLKRVIVQWIRLYSTHKKGLFEYLDDPRLPRTNTMIEREYSQEVSFWRKLAGRNQVNYNVHIKGDLWLKTHRHYDPNDIQYIFNQYSLPKIMENRKILSERRKKERSTWRGTRKEQEGIQEMKKRIKEMEKQSRVLST